MKCAPFKCLQNKYRILQSSCLKLYFKKLSHIDFIYSLKGNDVAFNAHGLYVFSKYVKSFQTVIYKTTNAYNASTGHFTAPVDGIYFFTVQICSQYNHGLFFYLEKGYADMDGATRLKAANQYSSNDAACTSSSTSVKLNRNEHVWVLMDRIYTGSTIYKQDPYAWNTFTGTFIKELS
ncbi:hypothetical protein DPMN_189433 [Dreissena polymorpha]|uniref:C1q domain-containing protein n=1 Tax=Dreissena polymorpha TaxID=45954 RepID=A0A9D4IC73_DREPO|nr:hypothetical protein DPMN_189433 [Dreissena polymorpha]